jgi:hypothetical protein
MRRSSTKGTAPVAFREVGSQLNVPTSLTPAPSHLLSCNLVGCAKEISKLINCPSMSLLGTQVGGTGADVITQSIKSDFFAGWQFRGI